MELKKLRKERKLSQQQVAEMLGIRQTTYSNFERGFRRPKVEVAKKIADILGFDWTELYK